MKQEVARRNRWPLDAVLLASEVTKLPDEGAVRQPPDDGVYVHGLFLDGAAWSAREGKLVDAAPKALFCPLPVVHISAVQAGAKRGAGQFSCPLYRGKARTGLRYVDTLQLRTDQAASKWTLRGVAALLSCD